MTTDITEVLLEARRRASKWSKDDFDRCVIEIENLVRPLFVQHLDWYSSEQWTRIYVDVDPREQETETTIMVRFDMPLVFVQDSQFHALAERLSQRELLVLIPFVNTKERVFSIEPHAVKQIFPMAVWDSEISVAEFSVDELWWTTMV